MTIAYRQSSKTGIVGGVTSVAVAVPSGATTDDIVLVFLYLESTSKTITPASGFAELCHVDRATSYRHYCFWKRLTGSDSGSYSFSWTGGVNAAGMAIAFSGCIATGDPNDQTPATGTTAGWAYPPYVSLTTTVDGDMLVYANANYDGTSPTAPTGWTRPQYQEYMEECYLAQATAGATGNVRGNYECDSPSSMLIALKPATGGGAIAGTAALGISPSATAGGAGALAGTSAATATPAATIKGAGVLAAASSASFTSSATATGSGAIASVLSLAATLSAVLVGSGTLTGTSAIAATPTATLTASGALAGTAAATITPSGTAHNATPDGQLQGVAALSVSPDGTIVGSGGLAGSSVIAATPAATLDGSGGLAGTWSIAGTLSGTIGGSGALAGSPTIFIAAIGTLESEGVCAGVATCVVDLTGALHGTGQLSGQTTIIVAANAAVVVGITLYCHHGPRLFVGGAKLPQAASGGADLAEARTGGADVAQAIRGEDRR